MRLTVFATAGLSFVLGHTSVDEIELDAAKPGAMANSAVTWLNTAKPNDNTRAAGAYRNGGYTVSLEARSALWYPDGDSSAAAQMFAFAESGGATSIPGPMIRVQAGTSASISVHNALTDTLLVYGLHDRPTTGAPDTRPLLLAPGATQRVEIRLDAPGTYFYWGTTTRRAMNFRTGIDGQLTGALIIDPLGVDTARARDRVFVIGMWSDTVHRAGTHRKRVLGVVNGRSWPHTERLSYQVGDSVRWRVINASADLHPMHLHGFYFRVTSRGDGIRDTVYSERDGQPAGELAFTESMATPQTLTMTWIPERAGNWLFHCHVAEHFGSRGPLGVEARSDAHNTHDHASGGMSGLVVGIHVLPSNASTSLGNSAPSEMTGARAAGPERRMRLLVRSTIGSSDATPSYAYAVHEGGNEPVLDSGVVASPVLDLVRDQPVRITVVNRLSEPTAVHWHGIELESYYDGVPGFSGQARQVTPLIAPNDSFVVRFTPPRSGTFMYHTHVAEVRQQSAGLVGALIVREPGTRRDSTVDIPIVITSPADFTLAGRQALLNGRSAPELMTMTVGRTYRLRLIEISVPRAAVTALLLRGVAGDTLVSWRPVAKDAVELPGAARISQPARVFIGVGETMDYEFTPTASGIMRFEVRFGLPPGAMIGRNEVTAAVWRIRVIPADSTR